FHFPLVHTFNPNNFATFLTLSIPLIFMMEHPQKKIMRLFKFVLISTIVVNVIMSESRGNLSVLTLIFILKSYWKLNKNSLLRNSLKILTIVSILMSIPAMIWYGLANTFDERILIWINTLKTLGSTLLIGVGVGNTEYINANIGHSNTRIYSAHNFLLEFFSDFGLIPFFLFMTWLLFLYFLSKRTFPNENLKLYLIVFTIVMMIPSSMVGMYYVWFGFGIIISKINMHEREFDSQTHLSN